MCKRANRLSQCCIYLTMTFCCFRLQEKSLSHRIWAKKQEYLNHLISYESFFLKKQNNTFKNKIHTLKHSHIASMLYTFFSTFGGWVSGLPARTTILSHHHNIALDISLNLTFSPEFKCAMCSGTVWSLSKWRTSTRGTIDGRPWAHWKGSWQADKDATKLWHSSLLRVSLNLMAPVQCKHV